MGETEFLTLAEGVLDQIETYADDWVASTDFDLEVIRQGNVLTLIFDGQEHVVINIQVPMQEIWIASRDGGFHYRWQAGRWCDTRGGVDLDKRLAQFVLQLTAMAFTLELSS